MRKKNEQALYDYQALLREYSFLASRPELSCQEADRLDEILATAESDEVLSFWLSELDYMIGQRLGLLDESHTHEYRNEQAFLMEYLGSNLENLLSVYREVQRLLYSQGFYYGPKDGIYSVELSRAIEKFQASRDLVVDGILSFKVLLLLCSTPKELAQFVCESQLSRD